MKQIAGDTIILQMCTKNHNHMMVGLSKTEGFFVILGQFFPFYPSPLLTTGKIKILKKWKNHLEMSCYTCVSKITYDVCFLRLGVQQTRFVILDHFLHFYFTNNPNIQNFEKMEKKKKKKIPWRYYHFTQGYHKWQSHNVRFLRYGVRQTKLFVILDLVLPLYPPWQPRKSKFWKRYYHFTPVYHKWQSYLVPEIWRPTTRFFLPFWAIFAFLLP